MFRYRHINAFHVLVISANIELQWNSLYNVNSCLHGWAVQIVSAFRNEIDRRSFLFPLKSFQTIRHYAVQFQIRSITSYKGSDLRLFNILFHRKQQSRYYFRFSFLRHAQTIDLVFCHCI